jgi:hypothetical protein
LHRCSIIVWDTGSRHQRSGAPRALWYGAEFIRYALQRMWCGAGGSAHVRGHNVARDFEQTCRK